mgnify:CR=1 FL=1
MRETCYHRSERDTICPVHFSAFDGAQTCRWATMVMRDDLNLYRHQLGVIRNYARAGCYIGSMTPREAWSVIVSRMRALRATMRAGGVTITPRPR